MKQQYKKCISSSTEEKLEFNESFKRFPELLLYMKTQWFEGKFCKWQIFRTPPGFATTNSNIESFNSVIKRDFTSRKRQSIMNAINIINEIIIYYSTNFKDFSLAPRYNSRIKMLAHKVTKNNFIQKSKHKLEYKGKANSFTINLNDRFAYKSCSCDCKNYLKFAICMHLVAYSNIYHLNLYNPKYSNNIEKDEEDENFVHKIKKGRKTGSYKKAEKALVKK
jgi:hypothetical protein